MSQTITIGIIGANGQVGSEVCLGLEPVPGIRVVAICRSELSSLFLRRCGVECRHGKQDGGREAERLLEGCDVVADFSLPRGPLSEVRRTVEETITSVVTCSPRHASYVYMSSTMALGMDSENPELRWHRVSRTSYGAFKRFAEAVARRTGKAAGKSVFVLRLGYVNGELQAIGRQLMNNLRPEVAYIPDGASHFVFVNSIVEALVQIARGKEEPGTYTLLPEPQLTWAEVHEFYCRRAGVEPNVILVPVRRHEHRLRALVKKLVVSPAISTLVGASDLLKGYALWRRTELEARAMAFSFRRQTITQVAEGRQRREYRPYAQFAGFVGRVPGERLRTLSDGRRGMIDDGARIQRIAARALVDQRSDERDRIRSVLTE
jgi:nucleoside-diphosphate-sugar epimerase